MLTYFIFTNKLLIEVSLDEFNRLHTYLKLNNILFEFKQDEDKSLRTNKVIILDN